MKFLKLGLISVLLIPTMALAHGPTPLKFDIQVEVNGSPDEVWTAVNNLCAIKDWNESVTECNSSGEAL